MFSPHGARVSGIVEESPGQLEYEVSLYKEAPSSSRFTNSLSTELSVNEYVTSEVPLDQAVPIGTKLQLRAKIGTQSVWKFVKLIEVTVSPDPDDAYAIGGVSLVRDGCRNPEFASIIPHQAARYRDRPNEVFLDFEAFLLSSLKERSTLWIHSQIKACIGASDCSPDDCDDELSVQGRQRREVLMNNTHIARIADNIGYTVIMNPRENKTYLISNEPAYCNGVVAITGVILFVITISLLIVS